MNEGLAGNQRNYTGIIPPYNYKTSVLLHVLHGEILCCFEIKYVYRINTSSVCLDICMACISSGPEVNKNRETVFTGFKGNAA